MAAQEHLLADSGLSVWPDGTQGGSYRFRHALYQQVLYEQLGATRRAQLHGRIGARLAAGYRGQAGDIAATLALHAERGGEAQQAVQYWQQAGEQAARRNAYHEAAAYLTKGLAVLAEATTLIATAEERWWEPEVYRLQGALLLQLPQPDIPQAEACFHQALAVARAQQAKALELRAALSLSRLWQQQGQQDAARQFLAPIYTWFTEGFAAPDLQEAKVLLEALSRG